MADPRPSNDNLYGDVESSAASTYKAMFDALVAFGGGSGGGGSVLEHRVSRLEADVNGLQSTLSDMRESLARIDAKLDAKPSKAFVIGTIISLFILVFAAMTFGDRIQLSRWLVSGTSGASPSPQQSHQQSVPRQSPSGGSSETPAPEDSGTGASQTGDGASQ